MNTTPAELRPEDVDGPRAATVLELPAALDLANLVLRTLGTPAGEPQRRPTVGFDFPHVFNASNAENVRVCVHRGRVVCAVGIYPGSVQTPRGEVRVGGINALVTQPEYRRLGLATRIMHDAHEQMRRIGMHIGQLSTRIQDYYRKLGWESAGREQTYWFDRGNIGMLPPAGSLAVTDRWEDHVDALASLHSGEPVHSTRTVDQMRLLLQRKAERVLVALDGKTPAAYLACRGAKVTEHAGPVELVAGLVRTAFETIDDTSVATSERQPGLRATVELALVSPVPGRLTSLLDDMGIPSATRYQGLIKLLDLPGLLKSLGLEELRVSHTGEGRYRAALPGGPVELGEHELVRLLFGPERPVGAAMKELPVDYFLWPLERV